MRDFLDISYSKEEHPLQKLDVHLPDEGDEFPVFLYFHGGGFERGDKSLRRHVCETMTEKGIAVVNANYRLYPDAKYPDFIEDGAAAVNWVKENFSRYAKIKSLYVSGSSAGGHLTQTLCFDRRWLGKYGISPMDIDGFLHDAGQPTCHFNVIREKGFDPKRILVDDAAPLYHVGEDEKYPPMQFFVSDDDIKNRYEETMLMLSALERFGHTEPSVTLKLIHGKHCAYTRESDENGKSIFGIYASEFVLNLENLKKEG